MNSGPSLTVSAHNGEERIQIGWGRTIDASVASAQDQVQKRLARAADLMVGVEPPLEARDA